MPLKKSKNAPSRLDAAAVRWSLAPGHPVPPTTEGLEPSDAILGQDRAISSLKLGLEVYHRGYNVFVCGITGTGKSMTIKRVLKSLQPSCRLAHDLCYVHNFKEPDRPVLLELGRGEGPQFREAFQEVVRTLGLEIKVIVNSEEARARKERISERFRSRSVGIAAEFREKIEAEGFVLGQVQVGSQTVPDLLFVVGEEAVRTPELPGLVEQGLVTAEAAEAARDHYRVFASELAEIIATQQELSHEFQEAAQASDREAVSLILEGLIRSLARRFRSESVTAWLEQFRTAVLEHLQVFLGETTEDGTTPPPPEERSVFEVNVILSNTREECPVIVENNPNHQNLFGNQEQVPIAPGAMGTDFTRIRSGSILRAQGGYLIMNAEDLLTEGNTWQTLKRTLRSGELVIQPPESPMPSPVPVLSPEPIKLDVKIVLVGSHGLYNTLFERDRDFAKIFKIKADFDSTVKVDDDTVGRYLDVMVRIIRDDGLRNVSRDAVEIVMQQSMRESGQRSRLSTRFSRVADLLREADYIAARDGASLIEEKHMRAAVDERRQRSNLYEELLSRQIEEGDVHFDVSGGVVGQINGLTVLSTGSYEFGKPARITCRTAVGKNGFVNVERETEMTGSTFEKGLLIIQGFFNGRFAQEHAITFNASICFEQSYSYIDGDSASSTEIYVIMSALADIPLRQGLAVTGSVDQFGRIQPVGGVNEKIEGFFDTCQALGFTGDQGALIPAVNVDELTLADRVVDAIEAGDFHIYPVETIDQGIELLTGRCAGKRSKDGRWTRNSVNEAVQDAIDRLHRLSGEGGN